MPCDDRQAGAVTAEFAVALPAVLLLLAVALAFFTVGVDQVRCIDAARAGAREAARGEPTSLVVRTATRIAPAGSRVAVSGQTELTVSVRAPARRLAGILPGAWSPRAEATSPREVSGP